MRNANADVWANVSHSIAACDSIMAVLDRLADCAENHESYPGQRERIAEHRAELARLRDGLTEVRRSLWPEG